MAAEFWKIKMKRIGEKTQWTGKFARNKEEKNKALR